MPLSIEAKRQRPQLPRQDGPAWCSRIEIKALVRVSCSSEHRAAIASLRSPSLLLQRDPSGPDSLFASTGSTRRADRILVAVASAGSNSPKGPWVARLPVWPPQSDALARLVDEGDDEFETALYEHAADPTFIALERDRRRYRGAFRRRLRRRPD
jgi:hypothetical protein